MFLHLIVDIQVLTIGALHHVDSAALRSAAIQWNEEFSPLPKPLIVVNIGGPTSIYLISSFSFFIFILHLSKANLGSLKPKWLTLRGMWRCLISIIFTQNVASDFLAFVSNLLPPTIYVGNCKYGVDLAKELAKHLLHILASCGSIRMTFSARTPAKVHFGSFFIIPFFCEY